MSKKDSIQEEIEFLIDEQLKYKEITEEEATKLKHFADDNDWLFEFWQLIDNTIDEKIEYALDEIREEEKEVEKEVVNKK